MGVRWGYLILNLAVGGILRGNIKKTDLLSQLLVDYGRVYLLHCERMFHAPLKHYRFRSFLGNVQQSIAVLGRRPG